LCRQLTAPLPETGDPVVVELGPGTGVVTDIVRRRLGSRGRHLAVELNPRFAESLARRFPEVEVVCADARVLPELLALRGLRADVVLSGLPWAAFRVDCSPSLLHRIAATMTASGVFTQLGYAVTRWAPPARRQMADLHSAFEEVTTSRTVWRNVPPAVVHVARRPRTHQAG
jgi:phospholipid N-methyltransferase